MSTERSEEQGGGGGRVYGKIAWRSDLVKSQDAELHHGNAGNPQTATGGWRGGRDRCNDQFDIRTPTREKQLQKKRGGAGGTKNKKPVTSNRRRKLWGGRRGNGNQLPVQSPPSRLSQSTIT